ncbi:MAG TPA: HIT domain-containing protein [Gammaproteobacteria bacterium]
MSDIDTQREFALHPRLAADCHALGRLDLCELLLLDNALVPWFVLVPRVGEGELHLLAAAARARVHDAVQTVSALVSGRYPVDRLNVAAIGNLVPQLHIHVVGRRRDDFAWPGVVWGAAGREPYSADALAATRSLVADALGDALVTA